jgi:outer membrane lipoprotein-sorting protein
MFKTKSLLTHSLVLVVFFMTSLGFAEKAKTDPNKAIAIKILKKYNSAAAVEMQTKKQVTKVTLGTTSDTEGILLYSKNKIHFSAEKPTKTEIIYNKNVWVIEYPDLELDDKAVRKVTTFDANKVPFVKTIAELLSSPEKFFTKDTIITEKDDKISIESDKIKNAALKKFVVVLDKKDQLISSILLTDDLNTDTTFNIQKTDFLKAAPKNKFSYKKIKTDETLKP